MITERTSTEYRADCAECGWHGPWSRDRDDAEKWLRLHLRMVIRHIAPEED